MNIASRIHIIICKPRTPKSRAIVSFQYRQESRGEGFRWIPDRLVPGRIWQGSIRE